jgi:hypothetical protein
VFPKTIIGAAWGPQRERMESGIYFPLFVVAYKNKKEFSIFYLSADMQQPEIIVAREFVRFRLVCCHIQVGL